uniref:Uncharacterized protein n=1 Tax=Glossina pallidipes TaxID=7398 RepID=A0A1B0A7Q0_GLOPL
MSKECAGSESEEGEETYVVYTSDNKDAILRGQKCSRFILQLITKWLTEVFANYRYLEVEKSKLEKSIKQFEEGLGRGGSTAVQR